MGFVFVLIGRLLMGKDLFLLTRNLFFNYLDKPSNMSVMQTFFMGLTTELMLMQLFMRTSLEKLPVARGVFLFMRQM